MVDPAPMRGSNTMTEQILAVVKESTAKGEHLTTREIGERVGLTSPASVHAHLELLVRAGVVRYIRGYAEVREGRSDA